MNDANDALLFEFVQNSSAANAHASPASSGRPPLGPTNDRILYVGANPDSVRAESTALRRMRPDTTLIAATAGDVVTTAGRRFDLSSSDGRRDFVAALGLRGEVADDVARILSGANDGERGTLGRIAMSWSGAERGEAVPSRVLLSGHSTGSYVAGGETALSFDDVRALAEAMPSAARQIEDLHISGCFSNESARDDLARWRAAFPNLKTVWAYEGYSPGAPVHHMAAWEASTRGHRDTLTPAPWLREQNVASWSVRSGYVSRAVSPDALDRAKRSADAAFVGLMAGTPRITRPSEEPAATHYETYRALANRSERADRDAMTVRADQLLALRNYEPTVRVKFAEAHARAIEDGARALGIEPPDFRRLTRAEALEASRHVRALIGRMSPTLEPARELDRLLRGLDTFDREIIKPEWSTHAA